MVNALLRVGNEKCKLKQEAPFGFCSTLDQV